MEEDTGRAILGANSVTWIPTATDADGDQVEDGCDLCPTLAATPPDADGCP